MAFFVVRLLGSLYFLRNFSVTHLTCFLSFATCGFACKLSMYALAVEFDEMYYFANGRL